METYTPIPVFTLTFKANADRNFLTTQQTIWELTELVFSAWLARQQRGASTRHRGYRRCHRIFMDPDYNDDEVNPHYEAQCKIVRAAFREAMSRLNINFREVWKQLIRNAPRMGGGIMPERSGMEYTGKRDWDNRWVIECAIHPEADTDGSLRPWLAKYLDQFPPLRIVASDAVQQSGEAGPTNKFPGLTRSLQGVCISPAGFSEEETQFLRETYSRTQPEVERTTFPLEPNTLDLVACFAKYQSQYYDDIFHILYQYFRIGMNAVDAFRWCYNGEHLEHQAIEICRDLTHELIANTLEDPYADVKRHNTDGRTSSRIPISSTAKKVIADMNAEGNFDFLIENVVLDFSEQGYANATYGWRMYYWLINAATAIEGPEISFTVASIIRNHFRLDGHEVQLDFRPPGMEFEMGELFGENEDFFYDLGDLEYSNVEVEAYGPRVHPLDVGAIISETVGSMCVICLTQFGDEDDDQEPQLKDVLQLEGCKDVFHLHCIDTFLNCAHPGMDTVNCPCCRHPICPPRSLRPVENTS